MREAHIRSFEPPDRLRIEDLFGRLSSETRLQRFHSAGVRVVDTVLDAVTTGVAFVAEVDDRIIGLATYHPTAQRGQAELAIVVEDGSQRRGIGKRLLTRLSRDAERAGFQQLRAELLASNHAMLRLIESLNLPTAHLMDGRVLTVTLQL